MAPFASPIDTYVAVMLEGGAARHAERLGAFGRQFAVCERWFAPVPGPSLPNRWFAHCGTSGGYAGAGPMLCALTSVHHLLRGNGATSRIYCGDVPHALTLMRLWEASFRQLFAPLGRFAEDAAAGTLPNYAFVEPRHLAPARESDTVVEYVYGALRASPQWTRSMLVVTCAAGDPGQGRVPGPAAISPDGLVAYENGEEPFAFDRLGAHVPTVVVSPFVAAGTVTTAVFDHTSILATLQERFGLPALTRRDATARSLASLAVLPDPRPDAPHRMVSNGHRTSAGAPCESESAAFEGTLRELMRIVPAEVARAAGVTPM